MNGLLMKHRPKDQDKAKWEETWANQGYILQPLADTLKEWKTHLGTVKPTDFDTPNHYAKLIYELARQQLLDEIIALLPASVERER